jgi:arylsulfatase
VEPPRAENAIFIVIDALRADHVGVYGHRRPTTPGLDRFARRSVVFDRAYSATSWTLPSLASYMSSVYPSVHEVRNAPNRADHSALSDEFLTLAESLAAHGLHTAAVTAQPWISDRTGLTQGFETVRTVSDPADPREAAELTDMLVEWLDREAEPPFFLYAHYMGPHSPYEAPEGHAGRFTRELEPSALVQEFDELYRAHDPFEAYRMIVARAAEGGLSPADVAYLKARYDEKLAYVDTQVDRFLQELERRGLMDTSVVVVTADHGEAFNEHGTIFHGQHLHEEVLRVPLIAHIPGREPARIDSLVELIDLYPTFHEALGFEVPPRIQGTSLLPLLRGEPGDGIVFAEGFGFKIVTQGWSSLHPYSMTLHRAETIEFDGLYDLDADPFEQRDRTDSEPQIVRRHRELAASIWSEMHDVRELWSARSRPAELDDETRERLESLGYLR